jgi:hypothetical protein
MEGRKPRSPLTVHRAFAPNRLSDDLLAQAYQHVLHSAQPLATTQPPHPTPPTPRRKPLLRVAKTGGLSS